MGINRPGVRRPVTVHSVAFFYLVGLYQIGSQLLLRSSNLLVFYDFDISHKIATLL